MLGIQSCLFREAYATEVSSSTRYYNTGIDLADDSATASTSTSTAAASRSGRKAASGRQAAAKGESANAARARLIRKQIESDPRLQNIRTRDDLKAYLEEQKQAYFLQHPEYSGADVKELRRRLGTSAGVPLTYDEVMKSQVRFRFRGIAGGQLCQSPMHGLCLLHGKSLLWYSWCD